VYVTDSNNGRLLVFDETGKQIGQVGRGVGEGNLGLPRGIVVTQNQILVADTTGQGVFVYGPQTSTDTGPVYLGFLGGQGISDGQFQFPNGIAADGRGRIYVADSFNDRVQVWSY
jgi:tripartite motif-containing protein 71